MKENDIIVLNKENLQYYKNKTDWKRVKKMSECEIIANASSDLDNPPATKKELASAYRVYPSKQVNVQEVRKKMQISQELFAFYFGVSKRTLQEWEQGRRIPSGAARTLLIIISKRPEIVKDILRSENETM